jgi:hypothetical protein
VTPSAIPVAALLPLAHEGSKDCSDCVSHPPRIRRGLQRFRLSVSGERKKDIQKPISIPKPNPKTKTKTKPNPNPRLKPNPYAKPKPNYPVYNTINPPNQIQLKTKREHSMSMQANLFLAKVHPKRV